MNNVTSYKRADVSTADTATPEREHSQSDRTVCPECNGSLVEDSEHGELVCQDCGLVIESDEIDRGPEWRAFDTQEKDEKSRVGAPTTNMLHDKGLSTTIDWQDTDAYGTALSSRQRQKVQRLRTWNTRVQAGDAHERNLKQALGEIERMASALGLPETVRETASVIYRRALSEGHLQGRSIEGVATAALYAAGRQANTPRTLDEVAAVSRVEALRFKRAYRHLVQALELEIAPARPTSYLPRFASELQASNETERQARDLLDAAHRKGVHSGKNPVGLAAAALYAAGLLTDADLTQQQISDVADVSAVTIRKRYRELLRAGYDNAPDLEDASD
ncbi:transcription initiation factor IIB [Halocatena pleomorpha]|uniref:Transcription initiation factor IIB n=1 Tax=Halocatena pleomorpha TaxID=1785090 RepID=A0A3P3R6E6_9EURY|nr:TFIIB-type zinc ribbon-containing protein [Halocatena pleomorpha]RRJ29042.1 transcription initiation factor IIB 2 [Halocatena pleomorpha]